MRDRGFYFTRKDDADTVTVKVDVHWDRGVTAKELAISITDAYRNPTHESPRQ